MEVEDWFKLKRYPHIGLPLTIRDYCWVKRYLVNADLISRHSFMPLIHKTIVQRKYRADKINPKKNPSGKRTRVINKPKIRNIYYSSHFDSLIFSYYNYILSNAYEKFIEKKDFNNSIVSYRKIPICVGSKKNKCNIDFAKTSFEFLQQKKTEKLTAIVADVTSFFDNLDHKILKKQWTRILGVSTLPADHYNVFKALTRIKYVESSQLFDSYNKTMLVEKGVPNSSKEKEYKRIKIASNKFFKEKNAVAYCEKEEFLKSNLNLIISANNKTGIPQGSPISATLANVYMLDFDESIYNKVNSIGGFYQRYSDDLIVICNQQYEDEILKLIRTGIENLTHLDIQPNKTKVYRFEDVNNKYSGFEIDEKTKIAKYNNSLEYLGFSFDGKRVLVKNSGFSKFYRSMKRSFKKSTSLAIYSKNPDSRIFKSRLYKRFSHAGAKRKLIFRPSKTDKTVYVPTKKYYWGNYLSYICKANYTMHSINNSDVIKKQSRKFWKKFHVLMKSHEKRAKVKNP